MNSMVKLISEEKIHAFLLPPNCKKKIHNLDAITKLTCDVALTTLLTVNFRQPSHEFTFSVGMNFISYPLVLTPLNNVRSCMSVLEFYVYAGI
jgi:hypothetical protein